MKKLFDYGNQYVRESDWKDLALIKFCLCAMGILLGVSINPKYKKAAGIAALGVFILTYIPLMAKFADIVLSDDDDDDDEENGEEAAEESGVFGIVY